MLQNVSFTLHLGKVTALVGPSGSGKSSCVNILENFYPLQDGQVLLDGRPINMYDHKYLHSVVRATDTCILVITPVFCLAQFPPAEPRGDAWHCCTLLWI